MTVVTGLFDTQEEAATAVRALRDAGIDNTDISLVANGLDSVIDYENELADDTGTGAGVGAVLGGAGGLLAGLGLLTIPGIGPVVAGGWLLATAVGAVAGAVVGGAAGGFIGALTAAGISEEDAHFYAEGVKRGGTLVTVRAVGELADKAEEILEAAERVDVQTRRAAYEQDGWEAFDEEEQPYSPDEIRDYRGLYNRNPI